MNLDKFLSTLSDLWARHSPTVIMHVVLLFGLQVWVLSPQHIGIATLWLTCKDYVDTFLHEIGINIERGYALAAIGYIYLTVLQWLASQVTRLPGLRAWVSDPPLDPEAAPYVSRVLRTAPDFFLMMKTLSEVVEKYIRGFRERGEPEPYAWLQFDISRWTRFYGLSLLACIVVIAWLARGSIGAISEARVQRLLVLLIVFAAIARWQFVRVARQRAKYIRFAALDAYARQHADNDEDDYLAHIRGIILGLSATYWRAYSRHPTTLARHIINRLPRKIAIAAQSRIKLAYPPTSLSGDDWPIYCSLSAMHADGETMPSALRTDDYKERFKGLLECRGAGLCILASSTLGLAPSVVGGGSSYSFATRSHGGYAVRIDYQVDQSGNDSGYFYGSSARDTWTLFADLGPHPLELLIQNHYPARTANENWWDLSAASLDSRKWTDAELRNGPEAFGVRLSSRIPVQFGHTYILRTRQRSGVETIIALQCFGTGAPGRVLLVWKILRVLRDCYEAPVVLPWWQRPAWQGFIRKPESHL